MREIKFRVFDKENKRMYTVKSLAWENGEIKAVLLQETYVWEDAENLILVEYTGLKDKNGKEIYEGDIILLNGRLIRHVEYDRGAFVLVKTEDTHLYPLYTRLSPIRDFITDYRCEIIGNIYENPELINEI